MRTTSEIEWWRHASAVRRFATAQALRGMSFILRGFEVTPLPDLRGAYRGADNDNGSGPRSAA